MRRFRTPLRGSVTQNTVRVRSRARSVTGLLFRLGALLGVVLILIGACAWLWHIGWPQKEVARAEDASLHLTQQAQFAVKDVLVEGRRQTAKDDILAALGTGAATGAPILNFDPAAAEARLVKLPWVATAAVERRLPDTILVQLTERVPMARWQHETKTVVIDAEGNTLPNADPAQFASLPLVVGADAPAETKTLLDALKTYPSVQNAMTAAVRVSERRWDLHLEPNAIAKLPEKDIDAALLRLSQLIAEQKILERGVTSIDLRLPDRLIVEPSVVTHASGETHL
jgi:cell division protein FtsQ